MNQRLLFLTPLDRYRDHAPLLLRLLVGVFLIWGTQDNVLSFERMEEFAHFLAERGTPYPLFSAFLSAYAQFLCGFLILVGLLTRWAGVVMVIHFGVAIVIAHLGQDFRGMFPPLILMFTSAYFIVHGAGKLAVDNWLSARLTRS